MTSLFRCCRTPAPLNWAAAKDEQDVSGNPWPFKRSVLGLGMRLSSLPSCFPPGTVAPHVGGQALTEEVNFARAGEAEGRRGGAHLDDLPGHGDGLQGGDLEGHAD